MPPRRDSSNRIDPESETYLAYPIPNPITTSTGGAAPVPLDPTTYHGYSAFIKGQLGLNADRLGRSMDSVTAAYQDHKDITLDGLFLATASMKRMAEIVTDVWSVNCVHAEGGKSQHYFYVLTAATPAGKRTLLALAVIGPETVDYWRMFFVNIYRTFRAQFDRGITILSDGRAEIVQGIAAAGLESVHRVCAQHCRSKSLAADKYIRSDNCEIHCREEVDLKTVPVPIAIFRTIERQREVAITCGVDNNDNRVTENQFRMGVEVINENLNRRGIKPPPPTWYSTAKK